MKFRWWFDGFQGLKPLTFAEIYVAVETATTKAERKKKLTQRRGDARRIGRRRFWSVLLRLRGREGDTDFWSRAVPRRQPPYKGWSVLPDARTALMMPGKVMDLRYRDEADTEEKSGDFSIGADR
jgi:hypothetical protein